MILFRLCVSGAGHDPQHNSSGLQNEKKKSQVIDVCVCYKWSDFIRYGRFYIQHSAGWSQHRLENLLWFLTLPFSLFFDILPFLVLNNSAISVSQGNKQETKYWKVEQEKLSVPLSEPGVLGDSTEDTGRV